MAMATGRWKVITESRFPWEQEALDFVRQHLPDHDPWTAWVCFDFLADDGTVNEVDLLVAAPTGLYLVEIKSHPGILKGDAGTWTWVYDGRPHTYDNPLRLANRKAQKLASLLRRQKALEKFRLPYIEHLVFCSHSDLQCQLAGNARLRVCLRDKPATADRPARPGIITALFEHKADGLDPSKASHLNRELVRAITRAMDQAGVRPSQRLSQVGDYVLGGLIDEGPGYQDREAAHVSAGIKRRVRLYVLPTSASNEQRQTIQRAALREFQILEGIKHPGILQAIGHTEHVLGPALIFEHDPKAVRLDHYLLDHKDRLDADLRVHLLRQIAETARFAHGKRLVHRALTPRSILVLDADTPTPRVQIFNWQTAYREGGSTLLPTRGITATQHLDQLVEEPAQAYLAPEILTDTGSTDESLDIFSLGAIAYHLFSGMAPAASFLELGEKLRSGDGLQISSVINGAQQWLQALIRESTRPDVSNRIPSVDEFLEYLNELENELTAPTREQVVSPLDANKGDRLEGGFEVIERLGTGSCARVLLVRRGNEQIVLKIALGPEHNDRLRGEAEVLAKLRHQNIVEIADTVEIGGLFGLLMKKAGDETLAQRIRSEGRLSVELLQRFGEDLLLTVDSLEQQGIPHRDIKPDNLAVRPIGRGDRLHLVLFDFSLARTSADNIRAGTPPYLDPFLCLRKPPRWDLYAERFAAAITLYEMATGAWPAWGDGHSHPSVIPGEVTIDAELFEPNLREAMAEFFRKALRRDYRERHQTCEQMLHAWRKVFEAVGQPAPGTDLGEGQDRGTILQKATPTTPIVQLGLSTRALNALDRLNIATARDLLAVPFMRIRQMRGVGTKTRRELTEVVNVLRKRFPDVQAPAATATETGTDGTEAGPLVTGVDLLVQRLLPAKPTGKVQTEYQVVRMFLGLDRVSSADASVWGSQAEIAQQVDRTRTRVDQIIAAARERWRRDSSLTVLRNEVADILDRNGGVMTVAELIEAVLAARGSLHDEPVRSRYASAVVRAAVETERMMAEPRWVLCRLDRCLLVGRTEELTDYAEQLGRKADELADQDPLASPSRVFDALLEVPLPTGTEPLSPARLVKLAASASSRAAVSSRQEIYPRNMPALRALKLAHGALLGTAELAAEQIRDRVTGRYPEAERLPARPELDQLLRQAGWEFTWNPHGAGGKGAYVRTTPEGYTVSSEGSLPRIPTGRGEAQDASPETAVARLFEERLRRCLKEGAFLVLSVVPGEIHKAEAELTRRFGVQRRSLDEMLVRHIRQQADRAGVDWSVVLNADAADKTSRDWQNLQILVRRAVPCVEAELLQSRQTVLLLHPGLLGRYDQMGLLERLRDQVGQRDSLPGLWLLIPADEQHELPFIDGRPIPVISPSQHARIPERWLQNGHRAGNGNGLDGQHTSGGGHG